MKRRDFIKMGSFITVSVAALGVTACGSSAPSNVPPSVEEDSPNPVRPIPAAATGANWKFPQSIASGDPQSASIMLWTRVVPTTMADPDFGISSTDVAIQLYLSTDAANAANLGTDTVLAASTLQPDAVPAYGDFDGTVRHKLTGLTAGTVYFYQFVAGDVRSKVGRFKTAPDTSSTADVKFAFMSCQDWNDNHWGAFSDIVAKDTTDNLDFIVHLGDYIYETAGASTAETLHPTLVLPSGSAAAENTTDYRYLYKKYRSDTRLQAMHERFPIVAIWDDHEFSDDCWQDHQTYDNSNPEQKDRRRNANQAWFEYTPADISYSETSSSFQNIRIYRDLKFGQTVHLVMTDERLYRADHLIAESTVSNGAPLGRIFSRYLAPEATYKLLENIKSPDIEGAVGDELLYVSMLGATQRDWWKSTMASSTSTWKVWGNEVSLLRMGLNGTDALSTLIALGSVPTLATNIGTLASTAPPAGTGGNVPVAAAIVGGVTFGATTSVAAAAATAIATTDATSGGTATPTDLVVAAMGAGASQTQATVAVSAYLAAKQVAAGGGSTTAQASTAAQVIALGSAQTYDATDTLATRPCIRNEIRTNKAASPFFLAAMAAAGVSPIAVAPFFQKFLLNADQWDGYSKERKELMNHLIDEGVQNVVSVTGDIHAFFAGKVYNDFAGEITDYTLVAGSAVETAASSGGTPALVDLVTAGVSSTSWFEYIRLAALGLDPTNALIGKLVSVPVNITSPAPYTVYLNMLDYTMGRSSPASPAELAAQLNSQIKRKLAGFGVPEAGLDTAAANTQAGLAADPTFQAQAFGLATLLGKVGKATNPWLNTVAGGGYLDTEAQGYAVVTATTGDLQCEFRKLNPLVGTTAPMAARAVVSSKVLTITAGSLDIT